MPLLLARHQAKGLARQHTVQQGLHARSSQERRPQENTQLSHETRVVKRVKALDTTLDLGLAIGNERPQGPAPGGSVRLRTDSPRRVVKNGDAMRKGPFTPFFASGKTP